VTVLRTAIVALAALLVGFEAWAQELTAVSQVYKALEAGRYTEVEDFYARLRRDRERNPNGDFVFEEFYRSGYWYSSTNPADSSYWPKVDSATKAWVEHSPKSHLAAMSRAFALAYHGEALQARGGAWKDVDALAAEARRLMDGSKKQGASDVLWHATRLRVAAVEGAPRKDILDMIHAAIAVDPYPLRLWQEAAIALSPSGENTEDLLWLMRLAGQRTAAQEGKSMQARVLGVAFWHFGDFLASPFGRTDLRWGALHESFLDWKVRYPVGYSANLHGALACAANDRKATESLLAQIGSNIRTSIWEMLGGKNYAQRCTDWAASTGPIPKT
jgi:hypothetical protein